MSELKRSRKFQTMMSDRAFVAGALAAIAAVGLVATPAVSAIAFDASQRAAALSALVGRFTPATGDPRLLQRYASLSDEARRNFRFTPAMARSENRAVTLVVRARPMTLTNRAPSGELSAAPAAIAIAPVTYRLGTAIGYSAFAAQVPTSESVNVAMLPKANRPADPTLRPSRFDAGARLDSRSAPGTPARALDPDHAYSLDVTGSYRLSRNVDLTAGIRYKRENDRLAPITNEQRDSQAVYVGTEFRF